MHRSLLWPLSIDKDAVDCLRHGAGPWGQAAVQGGGAPTDGVGGAGVGLS